jgi:hypothetical protein
MNFGSKTNVQNQSLSALPNATSKTNGARRASKTLLHYQKSHQIDCEYQAFKQQAIQMFSDMRTQVNQPTVEVPLAENQFRSDKYVYFGDVVYIKWAPMLTNKLQRTEGILHGDKQPNRSVNFKTTKSELDNSDEIGCLFQIVNINEGENRANFGYYKKMSTLKPNKDIAKYDEKVRVDETDTLSKTKLLYGQGFSLKHINSGRFLALEMIPEFTDPSHDEYDELNFGRCVEHHRLVLSSVDNINTYFKFYPVDSTLLIGNPMDYDRPFYMKFELKQKIFGLKTPYSEFDEVKLIPGKEPYCEWTFRFFADPSFFNRSTKDVLHSCDIIQIFNSDSNEYLVCAPKSKADETPIDLSFQMPGIDCLSIKFNRLMDSAQESHHVEFAPDAKNSVYSFWKIVLPEAFNHKSLTNENELQLINLQTNTYLVCYLDRDQYCLKSVSQIKKDEISRFRIFNHFTSHNSGIIEPNSKFTLKARTGDNHQMIDVVTSSFKSDQNSSGQTNQPGYLALSMRKNTAETQPFVQIIEIESNLRKLYEFFLGWAIHGIERDSPKGTTNDITQPFMFNGKLAQATQYLMAQRVDEFRKAIDTVRNLLLDDFANFADVEERTKKQVTIGTSISEQIQSSQIFKIIIGILNIGIARYYKLIGQVYASRMGLRTILSEMQLYSELVVHDQTDQITLFAKQETLNEFYKSTQGVLYNEAYKSIVDCAMPFLAQFSYKNDHVQNCVLDCIASIFPMITYYKEPVSNIILNVLSNKNHKNTPHLHFLVFKHFAQINDAKYLLRVSEFFNLVAKAIKHNCKPEFSKDKISELETKKRELTAKLEELEKINLAFQHDPRPSIKHPSKSDNYSSMNDPAINPSNNMLNSIHYGCQQSSLKFLPENQRAKELEYQQSARLLQEAKLVGQEELRDGKSADGRINELRKQIEETEREIESLYFLVKNRETILNNKTIVQDIICFEKTFDPEQYIPKEDRARLVPSYADETLNEKSLIPSKKSLMLNNATPASFSLKIMTSKLIRNR